ncbi:MAG: DNA adenine methylase [Planctomycetota bacterium]
MTQTLTIPSRSAPPEKTRARPFLKWAGGKGQLLTQFSEYFPKSYSRYLEPFVGSGAVFFHLQPDRSFLADLNAELTNCYICIRDDVDAVIWNLQKHKENHSETYYYEVRTWDTLKPKGPERAARLIYLNKTCFNGLYRVNGQGKFNVPIGCYSNPNILDEENLRAVSQVLQEVEIFNLPFDEFCRKFARKDDFVYFDPPYQPLSKTSSFTGYTKNSFSLDDQERLRDLYIELDDLGCKLMLSNSWCPEIAQLYKQYARTSYEVYAKRAINCQGARRAAIKEYVILNYAPNPD